MPLSVRLLLGAVALLLFITYIYVTESSLDPMALSVIAAARKYNSNKHTSVQFGWLRRHQSNATKSTDDVARRPEADEHTSLRIVYVITPTVMRTSQRPDVTRLAQTLISARGVHWIIVEDSHRKTDYISELLSRMPFAHTHLTAVTSAAHRRGHVRGVEQRNAGLQWLLTNNISQGVFYFGDDDNAYDRRLFDELRTTERIGMVAVGNFRWTAFSTPVVKNGSVVGFLDPYLSRKWPIDMAVFTVNIAFWRQKGSPLLAPSMPGHIETDFLASMKIKFSDIEPKANNCTEVLVWHTRTEAIGNEFRTFNYSAYSGTNVDTLKKLRF